MKTIKEILLSPKEKHLIIESNLEWMETLFKKISEAFSNFQIETRVIDSFLTTEIFLNESKGYLIIYCSSLKNFIEQIESNALQKNLLNNVSLTFTEDIKNEISFVQVSIFSNFINQQKASSSFSSFQNLIKPVSTKDLKSMSNDEVINFLNSNCKNKQKGFIFSITKTLLIRNKNKPQNYQMEKKGKKQLKKNKKKKKDIIKSLGANSLISISEEVKNYIKKNKRTTPLRTTNYIVDLLKKLKTQNPLKKGSVLLKNIQRRVYDAINVMCALGIISKQKNIITFIDIDSNENMNKSCFERDREIIEMKLTVDLKQQRLIQAVNELNVFANADKINRSDQKRLNEANKIVFPFDFIDKNHQKSSSIILNNYHCKNSIFAITKCAIKNYDELIRQLSINNGNSNLKEMLPNDCFDYYTKINDENINTQGLQKDKLTQPKQNEGKSTFDLDFNRFNSMDFGQELSSNDNFFDENENGLQRNNYYFEQYLSPSFDLLMFEKNSKMID